MSSPVIYCRSKSFMRALRDSQNSSNQLSSDALQETLLSFLNGTNTHGLNPEILNNTGAIKIWSLRVNRKNRILLTMTMTPEGQKKLILLDYMIDHKYENNKFLQGSYTQRYLLTHGQDLPADTDLDNLFTPHAETEHQEQHNVTLEESTFNQVLNQLSESQQNALRSGQHQDKIFMGPPGSGKTLLLLTELRQQILKHDAENPVTPPFLYITESEQLANAVIKQLYFEELESWIQVLTLKEARLHYGVTKTEYSKQDLFSWIDAQRSIGIEKLVIAREFQSLTQDISLEDYIQRGERQSEISKEKRPAVWHLFQKFAVEMPHIAKPQFNFPESIEQIVYDEAQDASLGLLVGLRQGFKGRFLLAGDNRQRLNHALSVTVDYLSLYKQMMYTIDAGCQLVILNDTYRCPPAVADLANAMTKLLIETSRDLNAPTKDLNARVHSQRITSLPAGIRCIAQKDLQKLIEHMQDYNNTMVIVASQERQEALKTSNPYPQPVSAAFETRGLEFKLVILDGFLTELNKALQKSKQSIETVRPIMNRLFTAFTRCEHQLVLVEQDWKSLHDLLEKLNLTEANFREPLVKPIYDLDSTYWTKFINTLIADEDQLELAKQVYEKRLQVFYQNQSFEDYKKMVQNAALSLIAATKEPSSSTLLTLQASSTHTTTNTTSSAKTTPEQKQLSEIQKATVKNTQEQIDDQLSDTVNNQNMDQIDKGADINSQSTTNKFTDLMFAAQKGSLKTVKELLKETLTSLNVQDENGASALMIAIENNHFDIAMFLLKKGPLINLQTTSNKDTALTIATRNNKLAIVTKLLENGADINHQTTSNQDTALTIATRNNLFEMVKLLLNKGADINHQATSGTTALMIATINNKLDIVTEILKSNPNINIHDTNGKTALMLAKKQGNSGIIQALKKHSEQINKNLLHALNNKNIDQIIKLIRQGANINLQTTNGHTALMIAIINNKIDIVKELLKNGADINLQSNENKHTALMVAIEYNNLAIVTELLKNGADINLTDAGRNTALMFAIEYNNLAIVTELLKNGADINLTDACRNTALMFATQNNNLDIVTELLKNSADINIQTNQNKVTALIIATQNNNLDIVTKLLEKGADIDHETTNGLTALTIATQNDNLDIVTKLLEKGADIDHKTTNGVTALMFATENNNLAIVTKLLEKGADIDHKTTNGLTALTIATQNDNLDIVTKLLEKGADIEHETTNGLTALTIATRNDNLDIVTKLLEKGADINHQATSGTTALMIATIKNNLDIVTKLLEKGADIDHKITDGKTALMIATMNNNLAIVTELLTNGADINLTDNNGKTALMMAQERGYSHIAVALKQHSANPVLIFNKPDHSNSLHQEPLEQRTSYGKN